MRLDHYATLGVDPDAKPAEIRAAYLALLRTYHPDRNPSPEAAEQTQAIIAAFKLLNDFDQRNYYDWDRRRDREAAAEEQAQRGRRRVRHMGLAAGGIGLAAAGALLLMPGSTAERRGSAPTTAALEGATLPPMATPARTEERQGAATPKERRVQVVRIRSDLPKAAAIKAAQREERPAPKDIPKPLVRVAELKPIPKRETAIAKPPSVRVAARSSPPVRLDVPSAPPVRVAARPALNASRPPARSTTDLASLDQFVMNFYGQSWRYGDAPKRAVLERTRASFVARRGACTGDTCRRNAYLDLMRDVSSIVETGKPEPR
jgi:curved DNA-binding protein CbpA